MINKVKIFIITTCILFSSFSNVYAKNNYTIDVDSSYVTVLEVNGDQVREIYNKDGNKKMYPASMTKLMAVYVALLNIEDSSQEVVILSDDVKGLYEKSASVAGFKVGDKVSIDDLLYGALLPSGADAVKTLARIVSGSEKKFVKLMNKTAKDLAMKNTNFVNAEGLHNDNHYSTTNDISLLMQKAVKMPKLKEIMSTSRYTTSNNRLSFINSLQTYSANSQASVGLILGGKTGWTPEAGYCLTSYTDYNDKVIIAVTGDSKTYAGQLVDHNLIYNDLINNTHNIKVFDNDETIGGIPLNYSKELKEYPLIANETINVEVPKVVSKEDLDIEIIKDQSLNAPVVKDQVVAEINVHYNEGELYSSKFVNKEFIARSDFLYYKSMLIAWLGLSSFEPVASFTLILLAFIILIKLIHIIIKKVYYSND